MIKTCDRGHTSLDAANWRCPWCEIERLAAHVAELEQDRDAWMLLAKAKPLPMDGCPAYCDTGRNLSARVAELSEILAKARECAMWSVDDRDECGRLARALVADIDAAMREVQE